MKKTKLDSHFLFFLNNSERTTFQVRRLDGLGYKVRILSCAENFFCMFMSLVDLYVYGLGRLDTWRL